MPPVRTMSAIKPMKTERTHEENQERAYIAASRRSDRSLEARVESARRASEIHKRRTGRSLRVTEQDVVNEEMYEEEDDDLPMQYRRLTAHLQTQNAYFDRRINAYISSQMAMRQAMGQAVADQWQANNQQQSPGQFMNPGLMQMQMQMQQPWYQNQMLPPDMSNRSPNNYRQQPYPMPGNHSQAMRHGFHNRSASVATPQELASYQQQQQYSLSAQTSPVDNMKMDDRRMSLPVQNTVPHTPVSPGHVSPVVSRAGSSQSNVGTPQGFAKQGSPPQQVPTPPHQYSQPQPQPLMTSPFNQSFNDMMNNFNPLSPTLPMETQQMLGFSMGPPANMYQDNQQGMKSQQPFYSYNPNGKPKGVVPNQLGSDGLSQTLAPSSIDTSIGGKGIDPTVFMQTPQSAATDMLTSPFSATGMYNFEQSMAMEPLKSAQSVANSSGQVTPGASLNDNDFHDWANLFDFNDTSSAAV